MSLILASNSAIRRHMLAEAGVQFRSAAPDLDEDRLKKAHTRDPQSLALALAKAKALSVAAEPQDWVIGSDSVVSVDGATFSKPRSLDEAEAHLRAFSGRTMLLSSAAALARDGRIDWSHAETARLEVRTLGDAFIADYLNAEWPEISHCAGAFRMEARGATLFSAIDGSHFTILGMPLLPLLAALRERNVLPS